MDISKVGFRMKKMSCRRYSMKIAKPIALSSVYILKSLTLTINLALFRSCTTLIVIMISVTTAFWYFTIDMFCVIVPHDTFSSFFQKYSF